MNQRFHYEIVRVLGEKAGFAAGDAQVIAYSSQFVDDASHENRFYLNGFVNQPVFRAFYNQESRLFNPIQTGHKDIQNLEAFDPGEQRSVLVPFHFVPDEKIEAEQKRSFLTKEDGALAKSLAGRAVDELKSAAAADRTQKLIKLGIALHSYADSWAHDDFAGINYGFNKKRDCQVSILGKWKDDTRAGTFNIGHAFSRSPDLMHVNWRYKNAGGDRYVGKDNPVRFLDAAEKIFGLLASASQSQIPFSLVKEDVRTALIFGNPREVFTDVNFDYSMTDWRNSAIRFNLLETRSSRSHWVYDFQGDMKWFWFQLEAYNQREFVKNNLP